MANEFGLDFDQYENAEFVGEKLLNYKIKPSDKFSSDDLELFLQLLGLAAMKAKAKRQLDVLRRARINGLNGVTTQANDDQPATDKKPNSTQSTPSSEEDSAEDFECEEPDISEEEEEDNSVEWWLADKAPPWGNRIITISQSYWNLRKLHLAKDEYRRWVPHEWKEA